jgi:iron only hydrogenase large subunit-like protein
VSNSSIHAFVSVGAEQYDASDIGAGSMRPELRRMGTAEAHTQLPVLSSHCPGWVCYAEKSQPQAIPYVSTVKSAQQILGSVTKAILGQDGASSGVTGAPEGVRCKNGVYFVSVQPCFDKKLEASRLVSPCFTA